MKKRTLLASSALLLALTGCSLYTDVTIAPLQVKPSDIERGADVQQMAQRADYLRAVSYGPSIDARARKSSRELAALGASELAAGRFDAARRHLRAALDLQPFHSEFGAIAWDLAQVEYLANNFDASLEWANLAQEYGLNVRQWHLDYLRALSPIRAYHFTGAPTARVTMHIGKPEVPRIDVRINEAKNALAVVDSGAVLSIMSEHLASSVPVRSLGPFEGTFLGLLGEPIPVRFGIVDKLTIGGMTVENIPVAIMPDDKMRFLVTDRKEFKIDFLLGAHFLKELRTELDFMRETVTMTHLTPADRRPADDQNLFLEQFRPAVRGTVNRKGWFLFVLDTGSEVTFLNEMQMGRLPIQFFTPKLHNANLQGLGGATKHGAKIDNIEIGVDKWAGLFRNMPMYEAAEQDRSVGIVGENFLKNFRVVIDFGRMRVDLIREPRFIPPGALDEVPEPYSRASASPIAQ